MREWEREHLPPYNTHRNHHHRFRLKFQNSSKHKYIQMHIHFHQRYHSKAYQLPDYKYMLLRYQSYHNISIRYSYPLPVRFRSFYNKHQSRHHILRQKLRYNLKNRYTHSHTHFRL